MYNCLAIDVAKSKSMVSLISSCGEVLISPYEINHTLNDLKKLDERIKNLNVFNDTAIILESTGIYQMPVKRFFLENNYNIYIILCQIYIYYLICPFFYFILLFFLIFSFKYLNILYWIIFLLMI